MAACVLKRRKVAALPRASRRLEVAATFADLRRDVFPMLRVLGPHIHCDVTLVVKLLRLAISFMKVVSLPMATNDVMKF